MIVFDSIILGYKIQGVQLNEGLSLCHILSFLGNGNLNFKFVVLRILVQTPARQPIHLNILSAFVIKFKIYQRKTDRGKFTCWLETS